jgi:hypothetical protein
LAALFIDSPTKLHNKTKWRPIRKKLRKQTELIAILSLLIAAVVAGLLFVIMFWQVNNHKKIQDIEATLKGNPGSRELSSLFLIARNNFKT